MLFFSELISNLNKGFGKLLGLETEEDEKEGKESRKEDEDSGYTKSNSFAEKWGWISAIKEVSDMVHTEWSNVFKMEIREFLNILSFTRDYYQEEKRKHEELARKYRR
jgi:hypothetical protein